MCTEKEPLECHRTLLVEVHKLPPDGDMFRTRDDVIAEALERQARKFAYVGDRPPAGGYGDEWEAAP